MAEAVAVGSATTSTEVEVTSVRTEASQTNRYNGFTDKWLLLLKGDAQFDFTQA